MISDYRLQEVINGDILFTYEQREVAKELLALRKAATCHHQWNTLKLVECGGRYQYCTLCGAKKVRNEKA